VVEKDLLTAKITGQEQLEQFIAERLTNNTVAFHAPI